mgnify:CR=1 FL=1
MYRIRLLILLLISILFISCTNNHTHNQKYSLDYFGGEKSGLLLKNNLESKLKGYGIYDKDSKFLIKGSIRNSNDLYITNIDNTSDRELITTSVNLSVINIEEDCIVFNYTDNISQFYIFSSGDKFISNNQASKRIEEVNTDTITQNFVNALIFKQEIICEKK